MRSLLLAALIAAPALVLGQGVQPAVTFNWFEYTGHDRSRTQALPRGHYSNPILRGYYPDPAVERVGDKFYLVNSTFAHWPGIPIHESTDLVHWKLVGHALTDTSKYNFDGLNISRGVFAPSIHHHNGTFYIINTLVEAGGNFFVTAKDPAGPWSDPVWLKEIDGIDPSFFFDTNGKAYILNNGPPEGKPLYDGHRAIWMQEFDLSSNKLTGPRRVVVNGGVDISQKPIWIEGPHLYRINGWYYLMCAEGGTGDGHSEVIFRAKSPWGPFEPFAGNPILTQRDLPKDRPDPITNAGHADLVQRKDGSWWAVFLASRPYEGSRYNIGRETFLLPVEWNDGWPIILPPGKPIPYLESLEAKRPAVAAKAPETFISVANRDEFDGKASHTPWIQIHVPKQQWYDTTSNPGSLTIRPLKVNLDEKRNASFLARRQEDLKFDASTELAPPSAGIAAGLAAYQNESYWYFLGTRQSTGGMQVFLERRAGEDRKSYRSETLKPAAALKLRISADGGKYSFYYDAGQGWQPLRENDDGSILSTEVAEGFVGTVLGPYARQE
jgi:alpha-N-arabinofuranosidase